MAHNLLGSIDRVTRIPTTWGGSILVIEGWVVDPTSEIVSMRLDLQGAIGDELCLVSRPDVAARIPSIVHAERSGFVAIAPDVLSLPLTLSLADGRVTKAEIPLSSSEESDPFNLFASLRDRSHFALLGSRLLARHFILGGRIRFARATSPIVSAVVPVRNHAECTFLALWSLARQTLRSLEVLVVDNGSTDETRKLLGGIEGVRVIRSEENLHYLRGCNRGASEASGEYLLFLNNDLFLAADAIERAVARAESTQAGAVGGMLLTPMGSAQEAGCRVLFGGSTVGLYAGSKPEDIPLVEAVDFCSGAFLLTPRRRFRELEGFSEAFAPAYGEDADYCLRLRDHGASVFVAREARIVHAERQSAESTHEPDERIRSSYTALRERHPLATSVSFPNTDRPLVLIVDDLLPRTSAGQGLPRASLLVRELLSRGYEILGVGVNEATRWTPTIEIGAGYHPIAHIPRAALASFLVREQRRFEFAIVSRPANMEEVAAVRPHLTIPLWYDAEAIFALRDISKNELLRGAAFTNREFDEVVGVEAGLGRGADLVTAVSERECSLFRAHGARMVSTLSFGADVRDDFAGPEGRQGILFVGPIVDGTTPNFDATQWFGREVLPRVRQVKPTCAFRMVGEVLPSLAGLFALPGISLLGALPSLDSVFDEARLFVAPMRFSAGIPIKVIESAAHGVPVIGTSRVATQLGWRNEREMLVADTPDDFFSAVLRLLEDDALWLSVRNEAAMRVEREYSRAIFSDQIECALRVIESTKTPAR